MDGPRDVVELHQAGLAADAGELTFTAELDTVNHVVPNTEHESGIRVPVTTVELLSEGCIPRGIKIDVAGYERSVLVGALRTRQSPELLALVMETNGRGERCGVSDSKLFGMIDRHGYLAYAYNPWSRRLIALTNWTGTPCSCEPRGRS